MIMAKTLISFVGKGRKDGQVYQRTEYDFGKQKTIEAAVFFDAILISKLFEIETCILIGTETSSWSVLLERDFEDKNSKYSSLYVQLEKETEEGGVKSETLRKLEKAIESIWGKKCICHANVSEITEENCSDIIWEYLGLLSDENEDIVIDITHAFRIMPHLLTVALQFKDCIGDPFVLEIIYGELGAGKTVSPVRYLKPMWRGIQISQAIRLFFDRFDPELLVTYLKEIWPSGSKAILTFGQNLQSNYVLALEEDLAQIKNALQKLDEGKSPQWVKTIAHKLEKIHRRLKKPSTKKAKILALAELFEEKHLYGQAVTTLRLSYEEFIYEYYNEEINYDLCLKLSDQFVEEHKSEKNRILSLKNARNAIAHGGTTPRGIPQKSQSLPTQYKKSHEFLLRLFKKYGK